MGVPDVRHSARSVNVRTVARRGGHREEAVLTARVDVIGRVGIDDQARVIVSLVREGIAVLGARHVILHAARGREVESVDDVPLGLGIGVRTGEAAGDGDVPQLIQGPERRPAVAP